MKKSIVCMFLFILITCAGTVSALDYDLLRFGDVANDQASSSPDVTESATVGINPVGLKSFPSNLGRNFVAIYSKRNIAPALAGTILTLSSHGFDSTIRKYFAGRQTTNVPEKIADVLGGPEFMIPAVTSLLFIGHHSQNTKFRAMTYSLAQGYVLTAAMTYAVKYAVNRDRPNGNPRGFVSGHASSAFLWASVLGHYYGKKVYLPVYGIAILIATSRLSDNVHWFSDVVGGAALGFIVGNTVSRRVDSLMRPSHFAFAPVLTHNGGGLSVVIDF